MACPDATELARFALGTLELAREEVLREHVDACADCRAASSALVTVSRGEIEDGDPASSTVMTAAWPKPQLAAGDAVDRFVIERELGQGAASVVYAAYDPELDRKVALKLLRSKSASVDAKLLREGRALAKIHHPNVVAVYEVGDAAGQLYIALELVEGVTARQWAAIEKRNWREVRDLIVAAARGLAALHRAGLVHRDVKPDNIVIAAGTERAVAAERVRVVDFGLVGAGAGAGTPAYMPPEREPDERGDIYSLCATFAELVGGRGAAVDKLEAPARIRTAIAKGMAKEPRERFASMDALISAFADRPRWPLAVAAAVVVGGAAIATVAVAANHHDGPCDATPQTWTPVERGSVAGALGASARPFALDTRARVMPKLDAFASAWADDRAGVCRAYHERHELSGERFDLEVTCLERQRQVFAATLEQLRTGASDKTVDKAIELATRLPALDQCRDAETLARAEPLPADPTKRAAIVAIERELAQARVAQVAGDPAKAKATAQHALEAARAAGYRPAIANGAYRLADLLERSGDTAHATPLADEAIRIAAEARLDTVEGAAWILQIALRGLDGDAKDDELAAARRAAEAAAARSRDPKTRAELSNVLGLVAKNHGDYAGARDRFTASLKILKDAKLDGPEVAATLGNLSNVLPMLGDLAGARKAAEEASHRDLEMFGPAHPIYADSLIELASRDTDIGDFTIATKHQLEALKIVDATYGDDSSAAMIIHNNLASSLAQDHHLPEADVHARRALVLAERLRGPKHPATANALFTVANVAGERDDWPTAFDTANRALAIITELRGPDHPMAAAIVTNLGEWSLRRGEATGDPAMIRAAETYLRRALKSMLATPDSPDVAVIRTGLGSALASQGRHAEAIVELEAALALRQKIGDDPVAIGDTQSTLARSLWVTGKRDRAIELARAAGETFAKAGESASRYAKDLDGWRAKNHVP